MKSLRALLVLLICLTGFAFAQNEKIMIFGGENNDVYLGCLNCSKFESDSLFNEFGRFGSKFRAESIFNNFGDYGSKFSNESACNKFAQDPPIIVDEDGNAYGVLTLNKNHRHAIKIDSILEWLEEVVCE